MTRVRKLEIEELDGNSDVDKMFASFSELENLDYVILRGFRFRSMPSLGRFGILHSLTKLKVEGLLTRLPDATDFPPNILRLTLVNTSLDEDPMLTLVKLPNLTCLKLRNAYTGEHMAIVQHGFPRLEVLCIGELWHLRDLHVGEGAMPKLKALEISHCPYLKDFPKQMIASLSELKMLTTKSIAAEVLELDLFSRVRHVHIQPKLKT